MCLIDGTEKNGVRVRMKQVKEKYKRNTADFCRAVADCGSSCSCFTIMHGMLNARRKQYSHCRKIGSRDFRSAVESVRRFIFE